MGASLFVLAMATTAEAQGAAEPQAVDEVVVTGLRASLSRAIDVKREADVIVDSIASEDLGKFPDSNVAESLQRITGVSIDRSGGEGRFVTVRGFGPSFNNVLVNGRTLATENPGRQFSFDLLAAELISGADVYKSTNAALQEGGIGSTINVKTARPFDVNGRKIVLSGKLNNEDLSGKNAWDGFALFSDTFMDGRLGILGSISYQERKSRTDIVQNDGYYRTNVGSGAGLLTGVNMPQANNQIVDEQNRSRLGVTGTVQFRASDDLTFTVDGLYNEFEVESNASQIGHFFSPSALTNVVLDSNRTVVAFDQNANGHTDYVTRTFNRPTELRALGFNADWDPTDQINVKFDTSWSKAQSNNGGNEIFAVIGFNNAIKFDSRGGGLPSLTAASGFTNPNVGRAHFATREGFDISEEVYEQRIDATFTTEYEHFKALKFGGIYTDRTKDNALIRSDNDVGCAYCGYGIPVPAGLLKPFNPGSFLDGEGGNFPRQWLTFDAEAYFTFLESQAAANAQDVAAGRPLGATYAFLQSRNGYDPVRYPASYNVNEKLAGGYVQADFEGQIGGLPWAAAFGVRYVHTELVSKGSQTTLLDLLPILGDSTAYTQVLSATPAPVSRTTNYDDFLPTVNVKVDLTEDMVMRFAASRSVTRPNLTSVAPQLSFTSVRPGNLAAAGGNPDLKPFKSTNFDASYEWYYQDAGYFTVGAFYKRIDNFIVSGVATENFSIANASGLFPGSTVAFQVRRPRNVESADVYGLEIGFQHTFDYLPAPFDGLGFTANATFVESTAELDQSNIAQTFALEGLGNSQNLVGFYAKGPIELRVAYNHRQGFLQTAANGTGGDPIYVKTAGQFDLQARYSFNDHFSVVAEAVNVNNAKLETHGRYDNQFLSLVETGPRYAIGVRAEF